MDIDKVFQDQLIKITQEAAISVYPLLGKNNKLLDHFYQMKIDNILVFYTLALDPNYIQKNLAMLQILELN